MKRLSSWLPWLIVALLAAWSAQGIRPVTTVEGDEQGVLFGLAGMVRNDPWLLQMRYFYAIQPGSYQVMAALMRIFDCAPETAFSLLTVTGAAGFALAGAWLLRLLLGWSLGWALVAMLWCQEVNTAAYYMNTSALAGAVALLAVILAHQPSRAAWAGSAALLAVAGWLRADSLLIAPACLGLAYWREKQWWPAIVETTLIALGSLAGFIALCVLSGSSLAHAMEVYGRRGFMHTQWRAFFEVFPLILSPALVLAGILGVGMLVRQRRWALGLVLASGIAASLVAHGSELTTPKYFYYIVPFLLIPALAAVDAIRAAIATGPRSLRLALPLCAGGILLADAGLGLRTVTPERRVLLPAPTLATLAHTTWREKPLALVVGPGELIPNVDGFRVRTGHGFAPLAWRREKQRIQTDIAIIRSWLQDRSDLTIYWSGWVTAQIASRELFAAGFRPPLRADPEFGPGTGEAWRRGGQIVHFSYLGYVGSALQAPGTVPAPVTGTRTYHVGDYAGQPVLDPADGLGWRLLSERPQGLVTLQQRAAPHTP